MMGSRTTQKVFAVYQPEEVLISSGRELRFFGYVVSSKDIYMEDERIEAVKLWPEPQSVRDI